MGPPPQMPVVECKYIYSSTAFSYKLEYFNCILYTSTRAVLAELSGGSGGVREDRQVQLSHYRPVFTVLSMTERTSTPLLHLFLLISSFLSTSCPSSPLWQSVWCLISTVPVAFPVVCPHTTSVKSCSSWYYGVSELCIVWWRWLHRTLLQPHSWMEEAYCQPQTLNRLSGYHMLFGCVQCVPTSAPSQERNLQNQRKAAHGWKQWHIKKSV